MPKYKGYRRRYKKSYGNRKVPKKVRKYVQKAISQDVENKIIAIAPATFTGSSSAAQQYLINGLAQGTGVINRIGNKVNILALDIRWTMSANSAASTAITPSRVRVILVWNRQTNGSLLSLPNLLQDPNAVTNINSAFNYVARDRYKVLYDKVFDLGYDGDVLESRELKHGKIIKYFKHKPSVTYNAGGATISDIVKNSLELYFISDVNLLGPTISWQGRLLFEDA